MWTITFEVTDISRNGSHVKDRHKFVKLWGWIDLWCIFNDLFFFSELQKRIQQWCLFLTSQRVTTFSLTSHTGNNIPPLSDVWPHNFNKRKSVTFYDLIQDMFRSVEVHVGYSHSENYLDSENQNTCTTLFFHINICTLTDIEAKCC